MRNQINIIIMSKDIYKCDEIQGTMPCFKLIGPQLSEWINCNGVLVIVPFLNGFLVVY